MALKTTLPLMIVEGVMCALVVTLLCIPSDYSVLASAIRITFLVLAFVSLILMVLQLAFAIKNRDKMKRKDLITNFVFQCMIIPLSLFGYFIAICFFTTSFVSLLSVLFAALTFPGIVIGILIWNYQILLTISASFYGVAYIWSTRKERSIFSNIINIVLQFIFIANFASSIYLLTMAKKDEEKPEQIVVDVD